MTSPAKSPGSTPIQPLHNPAQAAHVVHPQAPLGNVGNQVPGMGAKTLLAKKLTKGQNPTYISPTDNLMTPCTQKLNAAKKKHFAKAGAKPMGQLFPVAQRKPDGHDEESSRSSEEISSNADDENPF